MWSLLGRGWVWLGRRAQQPAVNPGVTEHVTFAFQSQAWKP